MCFFITGTLPPGGDEGAVRGVAKRFGRAWEPYPGARMARMLRLGETYYLTSPGGCDCETSLGLVARSRIRDDRDADVSRYIRRGWSAAKIERALQNRNSASAQRLEALRHAGEKDAKRWLGFLQAAIGSRLTASLGLLLHFYDGGIEEAAFEFSRETVSLSNFDTALLLDMEEDRLYEFFP
jgi:hypothetical protein